VSEESKKQLAESAAPPVRLITLSANGTEIKAGNEVCLFRHEKTFYNKPGLFLRLKASDAEIAKKAAAADAYDQLCWHGLQLRRFRNRGRCRSERRSEGCAGRRSAR
jgi:CO dehydrogenase/acetyl-CoA synthase gamma subunit (corrinoid Fe-S protein)